MGLYWWGASRSVSLLSGTLDPRNRVRQNLRSDSGQTWTTGETLAGIASTCCRVLLLACFVGPALVAPAVVALLPAGFAALADRAVVWVLFVVLCAAAVLVVLDEVDFA